MSRGRGRGGGPVRLNATADLLGVRKEDIPVGVREPPPLFPPVDPPLNLEIDQTLVEAKQEFRALIQNSEYYCREEKGFSIERYTDRYKSRTRNLELGKAVEQVLLPLELRSRKRPKVFLKKKSSDKNVDLDERLKEWEKKDEGLQGSKTEAADSDGEDDDADDEKQEKKLAEQQRREKEMDSDHDDLEDADEANDYEMNYFDNGEEYLMEDDLGVDLGGGGGDEDGPIY